jgi:bacterioferritin (cytochrome b1)
MIQDDLDSENGAIKQYKEHIKLCAQLDDPVSRLMLEKILTDEKEHADKWETILGIRK